MKKNNILSQEIKSFKNALVGIYLAMLSEKHLQIHLVATIVVIAAAYICGVTPIEWAILLLCVGSVLSVELLNTSIERLCDRVTLEPDLDIKFVKDVAAGAVLVISIVSAIIALLIFLPYVWNWE